MSEITNIYEMKKNGVSCLTYGMHVLSQPPIISPRERYESISIPGRSGTLTQTEGDEVHDGISLSVTCIVDDTSRIHDITKWISGEGEYEFYGHNDGYYKGRLSNQISFDRVVQGNPHKAFTFQFDCQPYFYLTSGEDQYVQTQSEHEYTNEGNVFSLPLIKIEGNIADGTESGVTIQTTGNSSMVISSLHSGEPLYIDCEAEIVYTQESLISPKILAGTRVSGDFLRLPTGSFIFKYSGFGSATVSSVTITPRWRQK